MALESRLDWPVVAADIHQHWGIVQFPVLRVSPGTRQDGQPLRESGQARARAHWQSVTILIAHNTNRLGPCKPAPGRGARSNLFPLGPPPERAGDADFAATDSSSVSDSRDHRRRPVGPRRRRGGMDIHYLTSQEMAAGDAAALRCPRQPRQPP